MLVTLPQLLAQHTIMNAVRLGDIIYGWILADELDFAYEVKPALSLESVLVHVKEIQAGAHVGYGATYTSDSPQIIGTIFFGLRSCLDLGYAGLWCLDRWPRRPIVGRVSWIGSRHVCLAHPLGTKVVLIGQSGAELITATDVAEERGTWLTMKWSA